MPDFKMKNKNRLKFLKSRSAESQMWAPDTVLFWMFYGIVVGFAAVFFVIIVAKTGEAQATIYGNLENFYLSQRFLKSPECFSYNNGGILIVNSIDAEKFNIDQISNCYDPKPGMAAFRISLNSPSLAVFKPLTTKNWNPNKGYAQRLPYDVIVYSEGNQYNGEIIIETQNI